MNSENPAKSSVKTKVIHELKELAVISLFLAFFFCSLTTYSMLLLHAFQIKSTSYGFALINALVIAKLILVGEYAKVGRKFESKSLVYSFTSKAFVFTVLVFFFHFAEEAIKRLIHGDAFLRVPTEIHVDELLARSIVVFCVFIPLFAFRELRRVLGESEFNTLLFRTGKARRSAESS
jgi:hypothetical protein